MSKRRVISKTKTLKPTPKLIYIYIYVYIFMHIYNPFSHGWMLSPLLKAPATFLRSCHTHRSCHRAYGISKIHWLQTAQSPDILEIHPVKFTCWTPKFMEVWKSTVSFPFQTKGDDFLLLPFHVNFRQGVPHPKTASFLLQNLRLKLHLQPTCAWYANLRTKKNTCCDRQDSISPRNASHSDHSYHLQKATRNPLQGCSYC